MNKQEQIYKFKGKIIRSVYKSEGFSVYALDVDKNKYPLIKLNKYGNAGICGDLFDLITGVEYEIEAIEEDTKYGISYKVLKIRRDEPTTKEETYAFLREILTCNQADTLIDAYPDVISMVKEDRLNEVDISKLKGIGEKSFEKIKCKIVENFYLMDLVSEFGGILSLSMLKKIYDAESSVEMLKIKLKTKPYTTLTRISGVGFKKADAIVIQLQKENKIDFGYDVKTSSDRCLACVLYLLGENENEGNTKANLVDIRSEVIKLTPECAEHFVEAIRDRNIYYNKETMDIALRKTYECEGYIAETILKHIDDNDVWKFKTDKYRNVDGFELSDEQMNILDVVCKNKISILNGAAGTGKTFSTKALINMLEEHHKSYILLTPTGKSSKVLSENTGRNASTIHRGLQYKTDTIYYKNGVQSDKYNYDYKTNFTINKYDKFRKDIIIVDEFSMVDVSLCKRLFEAINFYDTKLLMIGDDSQLPSVGCGNLFHDFIESNIIQKSTLTKVFRFSEGGLMNVATRARMCQPYLTKDMKSKATYFGNNKDYVFIDLPSELIAKNMVLLYKKLLSNGYTVNDIQVLTSKNVGNCGAIKLNAALQKVANPNCGSSVNMVYGDVVFYEGDSVMQIANEYNAELDINNLSDEDHEQYLRTKIPPTCSVFNGDIGRIESIHDNYMLIKFDSYIVRYTKAELKNIKHSYISTIHKSQGSGFKIVILLTPKSDTWMLNSNLIYTGLTRTKEKCFHLGSLNTVNTTVKKKADLSRMTFMKKMLKENI